MTRFARAKGSKASNEKLPEPATSWSEMKQELLSKNKEIEEQKNREKIMQQRQANYQAFLKEKEEEEEKKISWAEFPKTKISAKNQIISGKSKKRKITSLNDNKKELRNTGSSSSNKKVKSNEHNKKVDSEQSDEEFSALKSKIDSVLANKSTDSDSDAPPEELSIKEKPQEIAIKKVKKKPKQKLQILVDQEDKQNNLKKKAEQGLQNNEINEKQIKNENLTDKDRRMIEKKQERYRKQREKKNLKLQEEKLSQKLLKESGSVGENIAVKSDLNSFSAELFTPNESGKDVEKLEKKLLRRKKQKEKKLKNKQDVGSVATLEEKRKNEILTEKDLAKIQKKKDRRARQAEKRKKFREAKELAAENNAKQNENVPIIHPVNHVNGQSDFKKNKIDRPNSRNMIQDTFGMNGGNIEQKHMYTERKPYQKSEQELLNNQMQRKKKIKDNKEFQRNKPKSEKMIINGKTIEIDYVDGFPVKKEDADRIKQLRKEMISKGLPRSEINIALKLERRRAEKAFAREKKNVCFNCRKSGHNLSECPELDKDQVAQTSGTGICFKCGSTEHTHFECKVVKGLDYKFATCFICKEQGHISRQCPDNQRGLYPKGGACKVCGDVTHLKKDCPKYQTQQAQLQKSLNIGTLDNGNPDDLGSKFEPRNSLGPVKKINKIKF